MTNAPFLPLAELFGSRDQFWDLSQTIVPVREIGTDAWANGQLTGSDATSGLTAAATAGTVGVTVLSDCYLSNVWFQEPRTSTKNSVFVINVGWYRNLGGAFSQIAYLNLVAPVPFTGSDQVGNGGTNTRVYRAEGIPFGTLCKAGDLFSVNYFNNDPLALVAGAIIGYRGFQGPPA